VKGGPKAQTPLSKDGRGRLLGGRRKYDVGPCVFILGSLGERDECRGPGGCARYRCRANVAHRRRHSP